MDRATLPTTGVPEPDMIPIDAVARMLGIRASTIRYYEERKLIAPRSRHAGRRWYGPGEIRQLAIIRYWQRSGLLSLEEIGDILAGPAATRDWSQLVADRIDQLRTQAEKLLGASELLEHVLSHHSDAPPDGCRHFEALIFGDAAPDPPTRQ